MMNASNPTNVPLQLLGQSGCRFEHNGSVIYMDPYLSNSVQELDCADLSRLIPVPLRPEKVVDADWILITHDHIDHCDPYTLPIIAQASPSSSFIGPPPVLNKLQEWGIANRRLYVAKESWMQISKTIKLRAVPAAHPDIRRDDGGNLLTVGYVAEIDGARLYLAGDTRITKELIDVLLSLRPISIALLPVNEHNFFRDRRGIIGNMSVREAFQLAEEVGIKAVIPVHWDMFAANSVDPDEMRAVYNRMNPDFELKISPTTMAF